MAKPPYNTQRPPKQIVDEIRDEFPDAPDARIRQWIHVFNGVYNSTGDESKAYYSAWGVIRQQMAGRKVGKHRNKVLKILTNAGETLGAKSLDAVVDALNSGDWETAKGLLKKRGVGKPTRSKIKQLIASARTATVELTASSSEVVLSVPSSTATKLQVGDVVTVHQPLKTQQQVHGTLTGAGCRGVGFEADADAWAEFWYTRRYTHKARVVRIHDHAITLGDL